MTTASYKVINSEEMLGGKSEANHIITVTPITAHEERDTTADLSLIKCPPTPVLR